MKRLGLTAVLTIVALRCAGAAEYRVSTSGPFLIISRDGGFPESNVVSVRKSEVLSVRIDGKSVVLTTSSLEVVKDLLLDGKQRTLERSIGYSFENNSHDAAKDLFDSIMQELGSWVPG